MQQLHWIAFIGWAVVTVGIVLRPKEWMRVLGLSAGFLEISMGIPLAVATTHKIGRFTMFSLGPIFSLVLIVLFVWPNLWQRLTDSTG